MTVVEVLVAGAFMTAGAVAVARRQHPPTVLPGAGHANQATSETIDLPCPWCQGATREDDTRCPSCGQRFG